MNTSVRMPRIEVIATTYNRGEISLRGFTTLFNQHGLSTLFDLHATVVDDGSTDSTPQVLAENFRDSIRLIPGSGNLFWSRGMALAEAEILFEDLDYVLWFNDDVILDPDAISVLLSHAQNNPNSIIIGAMREHKGMTAYSGLKRKSKRPGNLLLVEPTTAVQTVDTFHGNLVLVPVSVAVQLGGIDPTFEHAYGDIDYGLRAQQLKISCLLAPNTYGQCEPNDLDMAWRNPQLPISQRLSIFFGRKGYPIRSHIHYNRRHGGILWPLFVSSGYAKNLLMIFFRPSQGNS